MAENWIRWWVPQTGEHGEMPIRNMPQVLNEWRVEAVKTLEKSGAVHVVYGSVQNAPNGEIEQLCLYQHPADDTELERCAKCYPAIYALHRWEVEKEYTICRGDQEFHFCDVVYDPDRDCYSGFQVVQGVKGKMAHRITKGEWSGAVEHLTTIKK